MKREDVVIIWLSLQLALMSWLYCKELKHAAYLEGQMSVYDSFKDTGNDGECLVPKSQGGCGNGKYRKDN